VNTANQNAVKSIEISGGRWTYLLRILRETTGPENSKRYGMNTAFRQVHPPAEVIIYEKREGEGIGGFPYYSRQGGSNTVF